MQRKAINYADRYAKKEFVPVEVGIIGYDYDEEAMDRYWSIIYQVTPEGEKPNNIAKQTEGKLPKKFREQYKEMALNEIHKNSVLNVMWDKMDDYGFYYIPEDKSNQFHSVQYNAGLKLDIPTIQKAINIFRGDLKPYDIIEEDIEKSVLELAKPYGNYEYIPSLKYPPTIKLDIRAEYKYENLVIYDENWDVVEMPSSTAYYFIDHMQFKYDLYNKVIDFGYYSTYNKTITVDEVISKFPKFKKNSFYWPRW